MIAAQERTNLHWGYPQDTCTRLNNFISLDASRKWFMMSSAVEWPMNDEDRYREHTLFIELSQNLIMMLICPFLEISLKASLKHITYFEEISFGSASWKKGASPWVIKYANFVEPRHNFPTILLSGIIIFSKSTIFREELYEKWLSLTFKAHNISAFRTSSLRT